MRTNKAITLLANNRKDYRKQLINYFLEEDPGSGTGELCSQYIYYVESLSDGNHLFLKRPAPLNKGFDFEVHVENNNFGTSRFTSMPSHSKIIEDLEEKKAEKKDMYILVDKLIDDIYECRDIDIKILVKLKFNSGHPIESILFAIKWLFIEQDINYWNWSGRRMFYDELKKI